MTQKIVFSVTGVGILRASFGNVINIPNLAGTASKSSGIIKINSSELEFDVPIGTYEGGTVGYRGKLYKGLFFIALGGSGASFRITNNGHVIHSGKDLGLLQTLVVKDLPLKTPPPLPTPPQPSNETVIGELYNPSGVLVSSGKFLVSELESLPEGWKFVETESPKPVEVTPIDATDLFVTIDGKQYLLDPDLALDQSIPTRDKILKDSQGNPVQKVNILEVKLAENLKIGESLGTS